MYGPFLSSIGGDRALTPPTRHSLGEPLPHQLADRPQAVPLAINLYSRETIWNYLLFREAMPDSRVRTYVLLPRLPVLLRSCDLSIPLTCMPYPRRQRSS